MALEAVLIFFCNWVVLFFLVSVAEKIKLVDVPDSRKLHSDRVPLVGGLAIFITLCAWFLFHDAPSMFVWVFAATTVVVVFGAIDDAYGLGIRVRLLSQAFGSILMIVGYETWVFSLGAGTLISGDLHVSIAIPLTIFCTVGLMNSFNMIDGIDGLASGLFIISLSLLCGTLFIVHGTVYFADWLILLGSVVLSFFCINISLVPLRKVFLGDAGSLLLGFMLGWIIIFFSQSPLNSIEPASVLWCVVVPVFDTLTVIFLRLKAGGSPFKADRRHIHHLIQDLGFGRTPTLCLILVFATIVGSLGIFVTHTTTPAFGFVLYLLSLFCYGAWVNASWKKRVLVK